MAVKKHNQIEMGGGYYAKLYENKSRGTYAEIWDDDSRLFSISTHQDEAIKAAIVGYKNGLKIKARSNEGIFQDLRLLGMSATAIRQQINSKLDVLEAEIDRLIPEEHSGRSIRSVDWVDKAFAKRRKELRRLNRQKRK